MLIVKASMFITCLVDSFYPAVGKSTVKLLRRLGVTVDFPEQQTCCGQVGFNSGFHDEARSVATGLLDAFKESEYVVGPSGSCVTMVRHYLPKLFEGTSRAHAARDLANRTYELSEFLVHKLNVTDVGANLDARVTYHASCHGARGLGVREEPLQLLRHVRNLKLVDLPYVEDCCGFGGAFAVKFAELSADMGRAKAKHALSTDADILTGLDMSCLMHIGGILTRERSALRIMHVAEILNAGCDD